MMNILTDRLLIRNLTTDDWHSMQRIAMDFSRSEYAVYDMPLPTEDAQIKALTARFAESGLFFAVELKVSGEMIGYICFHQENGSYDLGYCFHRKHQRKGYAFESCAAVMAKIKARHNVRCFTAGTALANIPSCGLLKKLGFALNGTETLSFHDGIVFEGGKFIKPVDEGSVAAR